MAERSRCLLPARIFFDDGLTSVDCLIRNISSGGALLTVSSSLTLPLEFSLAIPRRSATFRTIVRWSDASQYGVLFDPLQEQDEDNLRALLEATPRLRKLESEIARLRRRISELEKQLGGE